MQRTIGSLYGTDDVLDWLTNPSSLLPDLKVWQIRKALRSLQSETAMKNGQVDDQSVIIELQEMSQSKPSASLWSAFVLRAPSTYIELSLFSFLLGLSIYLGFVWTKHLDSDAGPDDSRNVFIIFIVTTLYCLYYYQGPSFYKSLEVQPVQLYNRYRRKLEE